MNNRTQEIIQAVNASLSVLESLLSSNPLTDNSWQSKTITIRGV